MLLMTVSSSPSPYLEVLGRLHPLLLHFPIAFVLAAAAIELVWWLVGRRDARSPSGGFCLWAGLIMGGLATWAGWLLADHQTLTGSDLFWHRWTAIAAMGFLVLAAIAWILRKWDSARWVTPQLGLLLLSAVLICVSGHIGAEMVWGDDWVFKPLSKSQATSAPTETPKADPSPESESASGPIQQPSTPSAASPPSLADAKKTSDADHTQVTWAMIEPIFEAHCAKCHGPKRQKGDLQLIPWSAIFEFEPAAWAVRPGNVKDSWVHQRIVLPPDHEDAMPPEGKADPLSAEQITMIDHWIQQGAPGPNGQVPQVTGADG